MIAISAPKFTLRESDISLLVHVVGPRYCGLVNNTSVRHLTSSGHLSALMTVAFSCVDFAFFTRSVFSTDLLWEEIMLTYCILSETRTF